MPCWPGTGSPHAPPGSGSCCPAARLPYLHVVQIWQLGPAAYPLGPVIGLVALGQALRRAGAAADVGAAVEAALGGDPRSPLAG